MAKYSNRYYALAILFVCYVFNFVDRNLFNLLLEPIKADLQLTDTQAGLLAGTAFALFYTLMGLPIAWLADRWHRVRLLSIAAFTWSAMTALTGTVNSFVSAGLVRLGLGAAESGYGPAGNSLIGDYFPPRERGKALGIFNAGIPVGAVAAAFAAGLLEARFGWRMTFVIVGAMSAAIALLLYLTVREPARQVSIDKSPEGQSAPEKHTVFETLKFLYALRSFRCIAAAGVFVSFTGAATTTWVPAFFIRVHGMSLIDMAFVVGTVSGVAGIIGMIGSGLLADTLSYKSVRWYLWVPTASIVVSSPLMIGLYLVPEIWMATALLGVSMAIGTMYLPPVLASMQLLVPQGMRAMSVASFFIIMNIAGAGLGPAVVGGISDALQATLGAESLRYSLVAITPLNLVSAWLFWYGAKYIEAEAKSG